MKKFRILVINPGSTSTKVSLFEDETSVFEHKLFHEASVLLKFSHVNEQMPFRREVMRTYGARVTPSPSMETEVGRAINAAHPGTTGSLGCAISEAVEDAVSAAMSGNANTPAVILTVLTQDGKSILPVHAIKARRMKKDAEEYGIFLHWCDNCECGGKYPNKAAALAEIEEMCKYVSARTTQIYKMK